MTAPFAGGAVPVQVRWAAGVVLLEGAALIALCVAYGARVLLGKPDNRAIAVSGAAMGLVAGVVIALLARALARGRQASFSPVVLTQLLALPVGVGLLQGHLPGYGLAVLLPAILVLGLLIGTPGGRTVLRR